MTSIVDVEIAGDTGIRVTFSDGTYTILAKEDILSLRPQRDIRPDLLLAIRGSH